MFDQGGKDKICKSLRQVTIEIDWTLVVRTFLLTR